MFFMDRVLWLMIVFYYRGHPPDICVRHPADLPLVVVSAIIRCVSASRAADHHALEEG